ncbi:MAG: glycosyltransferase family 2 protein [Thermoguttaceae bacterium]|jgi:GT2 family glycosyltransferase|nr:glycosyltransferase family 2 protein [Thermoguttaceae bacterium]
MESLGRCFSASSSEPDVDVGIVYTWERQWMPRLLNSLRRSCPGIRARLILVDNDSADGVEPWLGYLPNTLVVRNPRRLQYAANLNRVLRASTARYVLLLNTDMFFDPDEQCVTRMVRFMDSRPLCGVAGCGIYHEDGGYAYPARRFQTLPMIVARRFGLGTWMRRTLDHYLYRDHPVNGTWPCDWLSGCFLMVRREAIDEVGGFDESFVKYFEDVDMCLRMARAGWQVLYHGATYCYHLERRSSRNVFSLDAWRHLRSYLRWHWKWSFAPPPEVLEPLPHRHVA